MGGGQKAGATGSPHGVTLCDTGVSGVLQGMRAFWRREALARQRGGHRRGPQGEEVPEHRPGDQVRTHSPWPVPSVSCWPTLSRYSDPESCVFPFRSDQDNLKMPSNVLLTFQHLCWAVSRSGCVHAILLPLAPPINKTSWPAGGAGVGRGLLVLQAALLGGLNPSTLTPHRPPSACLRGRKCRAMPSFGS